MLSLSFFKNEPPPEYLLKKSKNTTTSKKGKVNPIDIIIPVYEGYLQTKRCIESVLKSNVYKSSRIIVINDYSPNRNINSYLKKLARTNKINLIENQANSGFVASVNIGMRLSKNNDVVLLNSDTEVNGNWLRKLRWHAYSKSKVSSVTPFSNNATICSYPNLHGFNKFPKNEDVKSFDEALYAANKCKNIQIPTAVGFCMYIRRECLNEIGFFDEKTFGKGYGEENEFCLRASKNRWIHLLAGDTFVFHEGAVSFSSESESKKKTALAALLNLYPYYEITIHDHIKKNEIFELISSAIIARYGASKKIKILHILHNLGGGTEKYVKDLTEKYSNDCIHIIMQPYVDESGGKYFHLFSTDKFEKLNFKIGYGKLESLIKILLKLQISFAHIHHLINHSRANVECILKKLNLPYYISVHDYMLICPQIILINPKTQKYCGLPSENECNLCLSNNKPFGYTNINEWLESNQNLINNASKVICPSIDVKKRILIKFPKANLIAAYHEEKKNHLTIKFHLNKVKKNEGLKIAILGILAPHKGFKLINNILTIADKEKIPINFRLIGKLENNLTLNPSDKFTVSGEYEDSKLVNEIKKYNPHLIFFASQCPETFSYTLSKAKESNYPILAPNIGAFSERLVERPWAWLYKWDSEGIEILSLLDQIKHNLNTKKEPQSIKKISSNIKISSNFYNNQYLKNVQKS
jgi:GT2 family glycosyltransferase